MRQIGRSVRRYSTENNVRKFDKSSVQVGWIGTGIMGKSMCQNLIKNGFKNFTIYNRTKEKINPIIEYASSLDSTVKVRAVNSPAEVASSSEVIFSIVGYPYDVEEIYLGKEGVLNKAEEGSIIVDMTTSKPSLAVKIYQNAKEKKISSVDAPVSGGDVGAKNGTLTFMIGGDSHVVSSLIPFWESMGKKYERTGDAGKGQYTKIINQILIAGGMMGLAEGLFYAKKAGLDQSQIIELLSGGAAGSWSLSNYGPRIVNGDFNPGFMIGHFVKDLKIALDEAKELKIISLPSLELAHRLYSLLRDEPGGAKLGTQTLYLGIEALNTFSTNALDLPGNIPSSTPEANK